MKFSGINRWIAGGAAFLWLAGFYGMAHAQSSFNRAPYVKPAEGMNVAIIAPGGKQILSIEKRFIDTTGKPVGIPPLGKGKFYKIELKLASSQAATSATEVTLRNPFSCGNNQTCWEIHHAAEPDPQMQDSWILSLLKEDVYLDIGQREIFGGTGNTRTLPAGTPIWQRIDKTPSGNGAAQPYLVLIDIPSVEDGYQIREAVVDATGTRVLTDRLLYNRGKSNEIFNADKVLINSYWHSYYTLENTIVSSINTFYLKASGPCAQTVGTQCYWMENTSKNWCWVPSTIFSAPTKERCFELDSCNGGGGVSNGGCYKWADCTDCTRAAWDQ